MGQIPLISLLLILFPLASGAGEPSRETTTTGNELNSQLIALGNSATSKAKAGHFLDAIADTSQQISLAPLDGSLYAARADYEQLNGNLKEAITDYRKCLDLAEDPKYQFEERFRLWITESEAGHKSPANHSLSLYLKNLGSPWGDWAKQIGEFLLGRISESDFLSNTKGFDPSLHKERYSEALYYTGIRRLLDGDRSGAQDMFRKSTLTPTHSIEFIMAFGELRREKN